MMLKKPREITLTVGVFFDGTGNNAINFGNLLKASESECWSYSVPESEMLITNYAKKYFSLSGIEATSYTTFYTNVYHLYKFYKNTFIPELSEIQQGIYIGGVGTEAGRPDSAIGLALGISETGVIAKTNKAVTALTESIESALSELRSQLQDDEPVITSLQFDIFGYSRGAAAARHFANRIRSEDISIMHAVRQGVDLPESKGMPAVKIRFIGLFDTVTATGIPLITSGPSEHNVGDVNIALSPDIAQNVFQIIAAHECRYNYALNSIKPTWPELSLPGVHSDIGGGYLPVVEENIFLTRPETETVPLNLPGNQTRGYDRAMKQMALLNVSACLSPVLQASQVAVETWFDDRISPDRYGQLQKRSFAAITLRNKFVSHDWSKVALRVMLDAAEDAGVMFEDVESDENLSLPYELLPLYQKACLQGQAVRSGLIPVPFNQHESEVLAERYIHCSANWNAIVTNSDNVIRGGALPLEITGFVNRPDEGWRRTVYNMNGKKV